jgi:hypothetical protein
MLISHILFTNDEKSGNATLNCLCQIPSVRRPQEDNLVSPQQPQGLGSKKLSLRLQLVLQGALYSEFNGSVSLRQPWPPDRECCKNNNNNNNNNFELISRKTGPPTKSVEELRWKKDI